MIKTLNFLDSKNGNFINFLNESIVNFELLNSDCNIDKYCYVIRSNKNKAIFTAKFFNQLTIAKIKSVDKIDKKAIYSMCDMANTYFVSKERIDRDGALACHSIVFKEILRSFLYTDAELTFVSIQYTESLDEALKEFNKNSVVYNNVMYVDSCSRIKTEVIDVHLITLSKDEEFNERELKNYIKSEKLNPNDYSYDFSDNSSFECKVIKNEKRYTPIMEFCMFPDKLQDDMYIFQNALDEAYFLNEAQGFINTITGDIIVVTPECRFFFHTFKNRREFKFELIK